MPFSSTVIKTDPYTPNGLTTNFPFYFPALSRDEVQVVMTAPNGDETVLTEGYDIIGIGEPSGGYVAFPIAPQFDGRTLTIRAVPSFAQEMDFENQGPYNPREINKALDRAAQRTLYLRDLLLSGQFGGGAPGGISTVTWASIQGKPSSFTPTAHSHAASDIVSGTLDTARIPALDAAKIGSGTLDAARVPGLPASKITSGTIDPARLPPVPSAVVASGDLTTLTAPQQALITEGVQVVTSDGTRYVYKGSGSKTDVANYTEVASGASDWASLSDKPPELVSFAALAGTANKLAYFSGDDALSLTDFTAEGRAVAGLASQAALQARASVLTTKGDLAAYTNAPARLPVGSDGQVLVADSAQPTGLRWSSAVGSSTGVQNAPNFATVFSGNPDGVTNNDAAFAAAEASAYDIIWLPEGRFRTTYTTTQLTKRYVGPGAIWRGPGTGNAYRNYSRYSVEVSPVVDPLSSYGFAEDNSYGTSEYLIVDQGLRRNFDRYLGNPGFQTYFWAPAMGHTTRLFNGGGWSGYSGAIVSGVAAGATTAQISGGTAGWQVGDKIGFTNASNSAGQDGIPTDKVTITGLSSTHITFTPALTIDYPAGSVVSHGYRTMSGANFTHINHSGGGDCYVHTARVQVTYQGLASQTAFQHRATGALFGGELILAANGVYGTGWEGIYQDTGFDTSLIGTVASYIRTVDTGNYGNVWLHDYAKMDGAGTNYAAYGVKPIDGVYAVAVAAKTGLDLTRSAFSVAAVAIPLEQKIALDAQIVGAGPGNGNGFVATTDGGMYVRGTNIGGTKTLELQNGAYRVRLAANGGLSTNAAINCGSSGSFNSHVTSQAGYLHGNLGVFTSTGQRLGLDGPGTNSTYFTFDGATVRLIKNGSQVAQW